MDPLRTARRSLKLFALTSLSVFVAGSAWAAEYYVAPTGSDSGAGTMDAPFASLQKGHDVAVAGDTVWIRGGTYTIVTPRTSGAGIALTKSGTSDTNRIKFWAYPGEVPVFDFAMLNISTTGYTMGFTVSGSFLHIKGLEIKNVPMNTSSNNGMSASGSNNIFELLHFHHISGTGIFINGGMGGNLILNCDTHDNYDPTSTQGDGQNADGFGVHYQMSGASTIIRGCRAWWNSDDGYDLINHEVPVIIENSWAMGNGYIESGTARPADGNGNGFKAGSSKTGIRHVIRNSLAWGNVAAGFYANHSSGGNDWFNNTSYRNGTQYNMLASDPNDSNITIILMGDKVHRMRNNVGYPNRNSNMTGVDTASNSWDLALVPADSDFVSVSDMGFMGPRQADGSLPNIEFMKLSAASRLIDRGVDVMLPFAGTAPDLGCFETGLPSGGAGGATGGSGGAGGAAGAAGSGAGASGMGGVPSGGTTSTGGTSMSGSGPVSGGGGSGPSGGTPSTGGTVAGDAGAAPVSPHDDGAASDEAGCGCATPRRSGRSLAVVLAGFLVAALRARRRRSKSPASSTP